MNTKKILIVEDNKALVKIYKDLLEGLRFRVRVARDGREAIDCLMEGIPDLVVLDLHLPTLSGFEVWQYMKSASLSENTKIMAHSADIEAYKRLKDDVDDFLRKPASIHQFIAMVDSLLGTTSDLSRVEL